MNVFPIPRGDFWSVEHSKGASPAGTAPSHILRGSSVPRGSGQEDAHIFTGLGFVRLKLQLSVWFTSRQDGNESSMEGVVPGELRKSESVQ